MILTIFLLIIGSVFAYGDGHSLFDAPHVDAWLSCHKRKVALSWFKYVSNAKLQSNSHLRHLVFCLGSLQYV